MGRQTDGRTDERTDGRKGIKEGRISGKEGRQERTGCNGDGPICTKHKGIMYMDIHIWSICMDIHIWYICIGIGIYI
jgi:hypothetical protein